MNGEADQPRSGCRPKPRVAAQRLPWDGAIETSSTPKALCRRRRLLHNPFENAHCNMVLGAVTRDVAAFSSTTEFLPRPHDPGRPAQRNEISVSHKLEMLSTNAVRYTITYSKFLIDGREGSGAALGECIDPVRCPLTAVSDA